MQRILLLYTNVNFIIILSVQLSMIFFVILDVAEFIIYLLYN